MTKKEAYERATVENLSNPNGAKMDIVFAAMDIWGKQEAIEFWGFITECDYSKEGENIWIENNPHGIQGNKYYTREQLFNLFKSKP